MNLHKIFTLSFLRSCHTMDDDQSRAQIIVPCLSGTAYERKYGGCNSCCSDTSPPSSDRILEIVESGRNILAKYQENSSLSRYQQLDFISLLSILTVQYYNAVVTIFSLIFNLLSLLQGILYLTRFVLDKSIDISRSDGAAEKMFKLLCFIVELLIVTGIETIMYLFMVVPVCQLLDNMYTIVF